MTRAIVADGKGHAQRQTSGTIGACMEKQLWRVTA